jgi:hypothetical protein
VAVETALVSMLLITLLFGIVDTSFLLKDWLTVSAAARAGARMGSSQPRMANFAQDSADQVTNAISDLNPTEPTDLEVWVYRADKATGQPASGASCPTNCVKYTWNGVELQPSSGSWAWSSQNACAGDASRDALGVYLKYKHSSPLGFFFDDAIISESTVMWIEPSFALNCK